MSVDVQELIRILRDVDNPNILDYVDDAADELEAISFRCETLEKMVKEYQDTIVPGFREQAEKSEKKMEAALKDLEEAAWCQHCINWKDINECLQLVKKEGHVRLCTSCQRKCACRDCKIRSKWKWRGEKEA